MQLNELSGSDYTISYYDMNFNGVKCAPGYVDTGKIGPNIDAPHMCKFVGLPPVAAPVAAPPPAPTYYFMPSVQTQVSPQISPNFIQQFQPKNSPVRAMTAQIIPTKQEVKPIAPAPAPIPYAPKPGPVNFIPARPAPLPIIERPPLPVPLPVPTITAKPTPVSPTPKITVISKPKPALDENGNPIKTSGKVSINPPVLTKMPNKRVGRPVTNRVVNTYSGGSGRPYVSKKPVKVTQKPVKKGVGKMLPFILGGVGLVYMITSRGK